MPSFNQLPLEILFTIFSFLGIPDIIRIRRVSWYLNHASRHRDVWADAYRRAKFIRPPGPFLSQTAHNLETALVPSFRADWYLRHRSGTAQSEQPMPGLKEIRYTGKPLHVGLVFGQFLLIALCDQVRCYNLNLDALDCDSDVSIIYKPTNGALKSFHCVSAVDVEGRRFACVVLAEAAKEGIQTQISIYLLDVDEESNVTLDLLHQSEQSEFDVCSVNLGPRVIIVQGSLGPTYDWHVLVFDVHARTQFLLTPPTGGPGTDEVPDWVPGISTSTHILLARPFHTLTTGWSTAVLAFTLPPPDLSVRSIPLSPSHRGTIAGSVRRLVLLHDTILDPFTGDIIITTDCTHFIPIRARSIFSGFAAFSLSKSHHDEIGTITLQLSCSLDHHLRIRAFHPTFNGTGRLFHMRTPGLYATLAALEYDVRRDDLSNGEPMVKTIDYTSILRFPTPHSILDYDPYSGRICFRSDGRNKGLVEILDLA